MKEASLLDTGKTGWLDKHQGSIRQLLDGSREALSPEAIASLQQIPPEAIVQDIMYPHLMRVEREKNDSRRNLMTEDMFQLLGYITEQWIGNDPETEAQRKTSILVNMLDFRDQRDMFAHKKITYAAFGSHQGWIELVELHPQIITEDELSGTVRTESVRRLENLIDVVAVEFETQRDKTAFLPEQLVSDIETIEISILRILESPVVSTESKKKVAQLIAYHAPDPSALAVNTLWYAIEPQSYAGEETEQDHINKVADHKITNLEHVERVKQLIAETSVFDNVTWESLRKLRWGNKTHLVPALIEKCLSPFEDHNPNFAMYEQNIMHATEEMSYILERSLRPVSILFKEELEAYKQALFEDVGIETIEQLYDEVLDRAITWLNAFESPIQLKGIDGDALVNTLSLIDLLWSHPLDGESFYLPARIRRTAQLLILIPSHFNGLRLSKINRDVSQRLNAS